MKTKTIAKKPKGMTLIELTVVILVLLALMTILFIGGRQWKAGADRTACLITIRNTQQGVRSYANMNNLSPGTEVAWPTNVIGPGLYVESAVAGQLDNCNAGGVYTLASNDKIPDYGQIVAVCSLGDGDPDAEEGEGDDLDHSFPAAETAGW